MTEPRPLAWTEIDMPEQLQSQCWSAMRGTYQIVLVHHKGAGWHASWSRLDKSVQECTSKRMIGPFMTRDECETALAARLAAIPGANQ